MNRHIALAVCAAVLVSIPGSANRSAAQGKSLKNQLVGTWIYVSSKWTREDGSLGPRPTLQGALTYNADSRFHFIITRTDAPKLASNEAAKPTPEEAMALRRDRLPTRAPTPWTKTPRLFTPTLRRARFPISSGLLISAGSSLPFLRTR
jgi:hypothetical protein